MAWCDAPTACDAWLADPRLSCARARCFFARWGALAGQARDQPRRARAQAGTCVVVTRNTQYWHLITLCIGRPHAASAACRDRFRLVCPSTTARARALAGPCWTRSPRRRCCSCRGCTSSHAPRSPPPLQLRGQRPRTLIPAAPPRAGLLRHAARHGAWHARAAPRGRCAGRHQGAQHGRTPPPLHRHRRRRLRRHRSPDAHRHALATGARDAQAEPPGGERGERDRRCDR